MKEYERRIRWMAFHTPRLRMMMMKLLALVVVCLGVAAVVDAQHGGCHSPAYWGPPNLNPINEASANRKLVGSVKNGKLYSVAVPNLELGKNASTSYNEVHVWGTPYEMGYAQGALLKQFTPAGVKDFIDATWTYMESQVGSALNSFDLPQWLEDDIENYGLELALDMTYLATLEWAPSHFYEEMHGLADAGDIDYTKLRNVHMIAGLTQGACSMVGAWGQALDPAGSAKLLQHRALDWDMDGPFRDFPQLTVYHPTPGSGNGHAFAIVGMSGFVGGLTGVSSSQLGISEIGVSYPDATFGTESRLGLPFIFLLRDILQFDEVLEDAENRMINAKRTCDLILGVGDGKSSMMHGFEYSSSVLNIFTDANMMPYNTTWHPRMTDLVYWGMDWDCPSYNQVLGTQLQKFSGKLTPEIGISQVTGVTQSGDNHAAWYDLTNQEFWVSFAAPHNVGGPAPAYSRQFTHVDANALWAEKAPTSLIGWLLQLATALAGYALFALPDSKALG